MSSSSISKLYVYSQSNIDEPSELVGRLLFDDSTIRFDYQRNASAQLTPFLHLDAPVTEQGFEGKLSVFRDAGPGLWGKRVLIEAYGQLSLTEMLIKSNNYLRIGNIRYSTELSEFLVFEPENTFVIDEIYQAFEKIGHNIPLTDQEKSILAQGSSIDGMQPKAFIRRDDRDFLLKMPPSNSMDNKAANECVGLLLAKAIGLTVPNFHLIDLPNGKQALAIERFDRIGQKVLPLMSAATVMQFREKDDFKKSYPYFAQTLKQISSDFKTDQLNLFKQMLLNVMISNRDDHIFNLSMLGDEGGWRLSPVYDVVCGEGNHRNHSMMIGEQGRVGSISNAMSLSTHFGVSYDEAISIVEELKTIIANWRDLALGFGVQEKDVNAMSWAILSEDIWHRYRAVKTSFDLSY